MNDEPFDSFDVPPVAAVCPVTPNLDLTLFILLRNIGEARQAVHEAETDALTSPGYTGRENDAACRRALLELDAAIEEVAAYKTYLASPPLAA